MKSLFIKILHFLARRIIAKYRPTVIAITGSVGKTAAKDAVGAVLAAKYDVRKSEKNYNTEIGAPFTILGVHPSKKTVPTGWLAAFWQGVRLLASRCDYPKMLVLEMAADKPGDMEVLLSIVKPHVGIITAISPVHTEKFGSLEAVAREKGRLYRALGRDDYAIVNFDDDEVRRLGEASKAKIIGYGIDCPDDVAVRGTEIAVSRSDSLPARGNPLLSESLSRVCRGKGEGGGARGGGSPTGIAGVSFKILTEGTVTPVILRDRIGSHQVYPALVAAAVAKIFDIHMVDVAEALRALPANAGRMRVLPGIKRTIIIDDSYNSSPAAAMAALRALAQIESTGRKYAVLGDMLELGNLSESEHQKVGQEVARLSFLRPLVPMDIGKESSILITIGERARDIARGAREGDMSDDYIFEFSDTKEAGLFIQNRLEEGDVILVKGSRGAHLEKIVKELMAEPEKRWDLLVPCRACLGDVESGHG